MKDFSEKFKKMGLKVIKKVEEGIVSAKSGVENTLLNDNLRKRFNLENPYRFVVTEPKAKASIIQSFAPVHAKRYEEDNTFIFYGKPESNHIRIGDIVTDLSDNMKYEVEEIQMILVSVTYNDQDYDVPATAVLCKTL
jgi:hypothetical protein